MQTNDAGVALIKTSEGLRLKAYPDPGTGGAPWTCGYGTTTGITPSTTCTAAQAEQWLRRDLAQFEARVTALVAVPLNANQFSALVSFAYNVGPANLAKSTLLKRLNAGDYAGAQAQFAAWNRAAGRVLPGLTKRRAAEAALFGTPAPAVTATPPAVTPSTPATLDERAPGLRLIRFLASLFTKGS